jgi:hypothetical protein
MSHPDKADWQVPLSRGAARHWVILLVGWSLLFGIISGSIQVSDYLDSAQRMHETRATLVVAGHIVGWTSLVLMAPALLPVVAWAFMRFEAERGRGPLLVWTVLLVILTAMIARGLSIDL